MSKRVSQLLLGAALLSVSFAQAASHGTYLTIIPGDSEMRSLVSQKCCGAEAEDAKTSEVALRAVYSRTWDSAKLGAYFAGANDSNNVVTLSASPTNAEDVDQGMIIRKADLTNTPVKGTSAASTITMNPKSTRFALNLSYNQDLKSVMEGTWFDLAVSLARVKNDLGEVVAAGAKGNEAGSIDQFFAGTANIACSTPVSAGLAAGRINSSSAAEAVTGPEQVSMRLGYNFVTNETGTFGAFVSGVAGLGTEPKLTDLFESVVGHRNMGLGLGVQGNVSLSKNDDYEMQFNINAAGHYMFARQDFRLGQVTGLTGAVANWTHYYLTRDNLATTYAPLANALRQKVNVAPRYTADLGGQFVYVGECVSYDLGYAMHYRAKEENTLVTGWNDAQYTIAGTDHTYVSGTNGALAIKGANLNFNEDSQLIHTIHGGLGYNCKDMENPVQLGLGASISLANEKMRSEQHWSVFAKIGVSF